MSTKLNDMLIYVVEDDTAVLNSLCAVLGAYGYQTEPLTSAEAFLDQFDRHANSCLIMDLRLPGMSGMELLKHLSETGARCPVIVITAHGDVPAAVQAMRLGAVDFIEKPPPVEQILEAIKSAEISMANKPISTVPKKIVEERLSKLTDREHQVLQLLLEGKLNKEIAGELGLSRRTVEVHRSRIREKMQARGIADLIRMTE
ncbi:response regulator [Ruegeria atlantica]|jgi:RNA polymerase sigma factor (sigma-70 family)|uniref:Response regulator n=1 Tax=Ruegeria atlantica TaxID=81569 RepID=A0AA90YQC3_9RHOB|nr:response regulator [Ruegeria atlantica]NOE16621.1 response regulator [Ruegeria atlantica]